MADAEGVAEEVGGDKPKRKKIDWRWTNTIRKDFIRGLAETYDVDRALAEAQVAWTDICRLRSMYPRFAAEIEEVIAAGYDRLEIGVLRQAGAAMNATPSAADLALARELLKQRRAIKAPAASAAATRKAAGADKEAQVQAIMARLAPLRPPPTRGDFRNGGTTAPYHRGEAARGG